MRKRSLRSHGRRSSAQFLSEGKPAGVICHGPRTLIEADLVRDRTITSWLAGGDWVDDGVVVDVGLLSSRKPDDLPAFCARIVEEFAEGSHEVAGAGATTERAS